METPLDASTLEAAGSTSLVIFGLAMAAVELLAGVIIGWWLRGTNRVPPSDADAETMRQNMQAAQAALSNLHELTRQVQADVGAHSSAVEAISGELSAGGENLEIDPVAMESIAKILEANQKLEAKLKSAEERLNEQAVQIEVHAKNALTDQLTGLNNRRAFDAEMTRRFADFERHGTPFCLLMLDVDHFKKFNDTHGHLAGDEVLRLVGRTLKTALRAGDIPFRYGGEEFGVIMPSTTLIEAPACGERIRAAIESGICEFEGKSLTVTASSGIAQAEAKQKTAELVHHADTALYAAKQAGRNRCELYRGTLAAAVVESQSITVTEPIRPAVSLQPPDRQLLAHQPTHSPETPLVEARTDHQTGLPNRTAFCEDVRRRLAESQRYGTRLSLMLIKVDQLSELVAEHGQVLGDTVLHTATQFLAAAMREMDLVARYDKDVFGVVLPGTALVHATAAGDRLRIAIANCPIKIGDHEVRFTVSIGVTEAQRGDDLVMFLKRAEAAQNASQDLEGDAIHFHNGLAIEAPSELVAAE